LYCTKLKTLYLPSSISFVGNQAFCGCNGLSSVYWDCNCDNTGNIYDSSASSYTEPQGYTFTNDTHITNFTFGPTAKEKLKYISMQTFWNCTSLKNIDIPDGVTTICDEAFWNTGLTSFKIPSSLQIPYDKFGYSTYNPFVYTEISSWDTNGNTNFYVDSNQNLYCSSLADIITPGSPSGYCTLLSLNMQESSYTIPSSVSYITPTAFTSRFIKTIDAQDETRLLGSVEHDSQDVYYNAWGENLTSGSNQNNWGTLESINLSNVSCASLPDMCFLDSRWLSSVVLPSNCSYIGEEALTGTSINLAETLTSGASSISCGSQCFMGIRNDAMHQIRPADIKKIIQSDMGLTSWTLFGFNSSLKIIIWDVDSFSNAGISTDDLNKTQALNYTFAGCEALSSVDLSGLSSVEGLYDTFNDCEDLREIILPSSVIDMSGTFQDCVRMSSITFLGTLNDFTYDSIDDESIFRNCPSITDLYFPDASATEPVSNDFNASLFINAHFNSQPPTIHLPKALESIANPWSTNFMGWTISYDINGTPVGGGI